MSNLNAQAKNAQNILRHWRSSQYRPKVIAFSQPDPIVAANPNVDIMFLHNDHRWYIEHFVTYLGSIDAIFYPGLHHYIDWLALKVRKLTGRRVPVISTLEGLAGDERDDRAEHRFGEAAQHEVYCDKLPASIVQRVEAIYEMSDHIIAISPFLARMGTARYGPKVSVLPLGVEAGLFKRTEFNGRCRLRVVGAGSVRPLKRPDVFVELARHFPGADFVWFGDGELRTTLQVKIKRAGLTNVMFPGALRPYELAQVFSASDIFVLPSRSEGVPKVTQEAAAAGLAQIVFGFYEAPTVIDGCNGFVVWSDHEMIFRLGQLLESRDLVTRMGLAGLAMVPEWRWETVAPKWEERIIDVLERRVPASEVDRPLAILDKAPVVDQERSTYGRYPY